MNSAHFKVLLRKTLVRRICGGELTCLQQPQASLDLLAVFHIQSGDPFAHRTGQYPTGISIPAGALSLDSNGPK